MQQSEIIEFRILCGRNKAVSRTATLDFRRANFYLFKDRLGGILARALEGKGAQESWLTLKHSLFQAQIGASLRAKKQGKVAKGLRG